MDNKNKEDRKRFGSLDALRYVRTKDKHRYWRFYCNDCGRSFNESYYKIKKGHAFCTCLRMNNNVIKQRTYKFYLNFIIEKEAFVCERWKDSFRYFYKDLGNRLTSKYFLDLKDGETIYCKDNCEWARYVNDNDILKALDTLCDPDYIPNKFQLPDNPFLR